MTPSSIQLSIMFKISESSKGSLGVQHKKQNRRFFIHCRTGVFDHQVSDVTWNEDVNPDRGFLDSDRF